MALILKINALIGILSSLTVSTATLVSKIKTTNFINSINKNISLALTKQQIINKKVKTKMNTFKKIVLAIGQELQNLRYNSQQKCHTNFKYVYITPLKYNSTLN